jgi:hypothetical protein
MSIESIKQNLNETISKGGDPLMISQLEKKLKFIEKNEQINK